MEKQSEPKIQVGIMSENEIEFVLNGNFTISETKEIVHGKLHISRNQDKLIFQSKEYNEITFQPTNETCDFELSQVTIGINFHWERKEAQKFNGSLKFIPEKTKITAINIITAEKYLLSVISSEMSATSSLELLKAHAVISRSWLFAQINKEKKYHSTTEMIKTEEKLIRWYDKNDHENFDVCADDHCQRYQGITKASTPTVREAIRETAGEILIYEDKICDARFSKSCGGATEIFESCWEEVNHPYLQNIADKDSSEMKEDLSIEENAKKWILSEPYSYCNTKDKQVLSQVLNSYDQETPDFYRWTVKYTQSEIADLIRRKTGEDFGEILDLVPIKRGKSGRLIELKIIGTKKEKIIGKELEIRKTLSESHLYSSAFIVEKANYEHNVPQNFTLKGAGWGHGVGLCQIGAAVMASKGYKYKDILAHYYPKSILFSSYI